MFLYLLALIIIIIYYRVKGKKNFLPCQCSKNKPSGVNRYDLVVFLRQESVTP